MLSYVYPFTFCPCPFTAPCTFRNTSKSGSSTFPFLFQSPFKTASSGQLSQTPATQHFPTTRQQSTSSLWLHPLGHTASDTGRHALLPMGITGFTTPTT